MTHRLAPAAARQARGRNRRRLRERSRPSPSLRGSYDVPYRGRRLRPADGERIGLHLVPFAEHETVRFKQGSYPDRIPTGDVFQDRHKHTEGIVAENGSPCDLVDVLVFRYGNGESVEPV